MGVVVGLAAEGRIARRLGWPVAVGGGTTAGAAFAARSLAEQGVRALVSFGLAGGLDPSLRPGAIIVPRAFLVGGRRLEADAALGARLGGFTDGDLVCGPAIVATAGEKARLFRDTGGVAVDLESGAVVRVASDWGLPFAALRAICDPAERTLPPAALHALSGGGAIALRRVAASVARRPGQLPILLALVRDAAAGRRALVRRVRATSSRPAARGPG